MLAAGLARPYPTVTLDTGALAAARILADGKLPGLIVLTTRVGRTRCFRVPRCCGSSCRRYVQDDPALARVYDEASADAMCEELSARTVRDVLPGGRTVFDLPVVDSDATSMEIAAMMAAAAQPARRGRRRLRRLLGAVTVSTLLEHLLGARARTR